MNGDVEKGIGIGGFGAWVSWSSGHPRPTVDKFVVFHEIPLWGGESLLPEEAQTEAEPRGIPPSNGLLEKEESGIYRDN